MYFDSPFKLLLLAAGGDFREKYKMNGVVSVSAVVNVLFAADVTGRQHTYKSWKGFVTNL